MSINISPNRIALRPGEQGARSPARNQAGTEKLATGMSKQRQNPHNSGNGVNFLEIYEHEHWPKFFIVNGVQERLSALDPITIAEAIEEFIGEPEDTTMLRSGSLLVQCRNRNQADKIESLKFIGKSPVKVIKHPRLNSCKGVVFSNESFKCTDEKLKSYLENKYGITDVYRMRPRGDNSQLIIVTFPSKFLPKRIKIGHEKCRVRPYVPNPSRCYNCQRFGHMSRSCRRKAVCARCGSEDHVHMRENPCENKAHCVNCNLDHPAYERSCPKWAEEKNILKLKVTKDYSYPEARRLIEQHGSQLSYAAIASTSVKDKQFPSPSQNNSSTPRSTPQKFSGSSYGSHGPRSSPRSSPRHRVNLSPNKSYSKYTRTIDKSEVLASANDHFQRLDFLLQKCGMKDVSTGVENSGKRKLKDSSEEGCSKLSRVRQEESESTQNLSFETVETEESSEAASEESQMESTTEAPEAIKQLENLENKEDKTTSSNENGEEEVPKSKGTTDGKAVSKSTTVNNLKSQPTSGRKNVHAPSVRSQLKGGPSMGANSRHGVSNTPKNVVLNRSFKF
jgi:hypothetical protein